MADPSDLAAVHSVFNAKRLSDGSLVPTTDEIGDAVMDKLGQAVAPYATPILTIEGGASLEPGANPVIHQSGDSINVTLVIDLPRGETGLNVQSADLDPGGDLVLTMSDDSTLSVAGFVDAVTPAIAFQGGTALPPGSAPTIVKSGAANAPVFTLSVPQGPVGAQGVQGNSIANAALNAGGDLILTLSNSAGTLTLAGFAGKATPAVTFQAGSTLPPGSPATVVQSGTPAAPVITISLPAGQQGVVGPTGTVAGLAAATAAQVSPSSRIAGVAADGMTPITFTPAQVAATQTTVFGTMAKQTFTGDGTTKAFTLSAAPTASAYVLPFVAGAYQPQAGFAVAGNVVTFAAAPASGAAIEIATVVPTTTAGLLAQNPVADPAYSVADPSGYTLLEVGPLGQLRPTAIQFGRTGQLSIPILNSAGVQVGSINADGSVAHAGGLSIGSGALTMVASTDGSVKFIDGNGWVGLSISPAGVLTVNQAAIAALSSAIALPSGSTAGGMTFSTSSTIDFGIGDQNGFLIYAQINGVAMTSAVGATSLVSTSSYSAGDINARNNRNLAYSQQIRGQIDTVSARPVWGYSHVIAYGQSLSIGQEGWPAISLSQPFDNLMIGQCVRPASAHSPTWAPLGDSSLHPLVGTNESLADPGGLVSAAAAAALTPGDSTYGETVLEGATNFFRKLQLGMRGLVSDASRQLVASSCGVGGMTIEALSKGASPELFNRLRGCATALQAAATAASKSYGVAAIIFMQGEANYTPGAGYASDQATYLAELIKLRADINADIATTIAGQASPPAWFTYQTNQNFTADTISIGMAQLNAALTQPGWYLAAPDYPVTDKGGHLDPNGYRWMGAQFGKVMHRVLNLGQRWLPLYPTQITFRAFSILVDFHVPEPPLVFDVPWVGSDTGSGTIGPATLSNQGFTVYDAGGIVPITAVSIASDTQVLITVGRALGSAPYLRYADLTYNSGNGGLRDSDPTISADLYSYTAGNGQYAAANVPALVGNPYPLWNWCVAFNMPIVAG